MSAKSSFPLKNPPSEKSTTTTRFSCPYCKWTGNTEVMLSRHISMYHETIVAEEGERARERGRGLNRFGTKDYGLPMWECPKCHYRVGPASLSERYMTCQKWQDMGETGKQCDGILVMVEKGR